MKNYFVYIMASKRKGTLYIGVTSNLIKRVWQHKTAEIAGFTAKYKVYQLVYYEVYENILNAIQREKNIKTWKRDWKIELIETQNPEWKDLYDAMA